MNHEKKFDPKMLDRLRSPERLHRENPETIWNRLALDNPSCIVDVGAGIGYLAVPFASKIGSGTVWGCDISAEMLAELKKESDKAGAGVKPLLTGEVDIPLPDAIADAVIMHNLHHEFDGPRRNLREAYRLLKSGGKVAVIDWKKEPTPAGPPVDIRVTEGDIMEDMKASGFYSIETYDDLPFHSFVSGVKPT